VIDWLFTNALAAVALAVIALVLIWTFRPAPAVRHALWLVVLLKLVSPTGLVVSVPLPVESPVAAEPEVVVAEPVTAPVGDPLICEETFTVIVRTHPGQTVEDATALAMRATVRREEAMESRPEPAATTVPAAESKAPGEPIDFRPYLLGLWLAGAIWISSRQVRETVRFARFTRRARPAPDHLVAEVAIVANRLGVRVPDVRVLGGLTSPVIWCLWRPVLLWPAGLECRLRGEGKRAVIAHELAHLRRRDHWVRRLEMIAAVLHWWNPLFWLARKKMRADAELACDAWATGQADRRAYAEALLEVCSFNPRRRPAPAVGVFGEGRRAMQERLTMIMRDRGPCRLAFGAKLVVAMMAVAAIPAWTLGQGKPEAIEIVVDTADGDDTDVKELEAQIKALAQKIEAMKAAKAAEAGKKAADAQKRATEALLKAQTQLGEKLKDSKLHIEAMQAGKSGQGVKVITAGEGGYKVIGPDGKELKDVKIIIVDPKAATPTTKPAPSSTLKPVQVPMVLQTKPGAQRVPVTVDTKFADVVRVRTTEGQAVTLSRATYKLNKDQAAALSTLLGSIKASVLELKADGDTLTVTTTPEIQGAVGQIVRLLQGQGSSGTSRSEYKVSPPTPATPSTKPAKPAKPTESFELKSLPDSNFEIELKFENLKDLEKLKDLKGLEKLKDLKDLEKLKDLKDLEKLKDLKELKIDVTELKELQDKIKQLTKPEREKKPEK